ncbi:MULTISPECIES: hypothetical protein [Halorubrum]|uniref:hypothetical protein n=1 Tax=Halorubrum TaxID=56688 RepID=UPI000ADD0175|nr:MULTISPECIES: hypothetical protein [Halorubrum]
MEWRDLVDELSTSQSLIGGAALLELVTRLPSDTLAAVLSVGSGTLGTQLIASTTTWVLFAIICYKFTPLIYSLLDPVPSGEFGFKLIFTSLSTAAGILFTYLDSSRFTVGILVLVLVGVVVLLAYFQWVREWSLLAPDNRSLVILEFFTPQENITEEIETDVNRSGVLGVIGSALYLLALGLLLIFPVFLTGLLSQVLVYAYPVPDLIFLGWVVGGFVSSKLLTEENKPDFFDVEVDIEKYLLDVLEHATRSTQGMFLTSFILLGILSSAGKIFLAVTAGTILIQSYLTAFGISLFEFGTRPVTLISGVTGIVTLLFSVGVFSSWAWIREFQRLPYYLDSWEDRESAGSELPSRPVGFLLVPMTTFAVIALYVSTFPKESLSVIDYGFAFGWPIFLLPGWWAVSRSERFQPVTRESLWIISGLYLEALSLWPIANFANGEAESASVSSISSLPGFTLFLLFLLATPSLIPYVSRYEQDGNRNYLLVWFFLVATFFAIVFSSIVSGGLRLQLQILAGVTFVGGLALGVVRYFDL